MRHDLGSAAAEGHGTTAGQAGEQVGIVVGKEPAGAVAGGPQALDGRAVFADDLQDRKSVV